MMASNPFCLSFGKEPTVSIPRLAQLDKVVDNFMSDNPPTQAYLFTGVRGSGKTWKVKG